MATGAPGLPCFLTGCVRGTDGQPIEGALLDIWQTDGEGLYEGQRGDETGGPWMRGLYRSSADGSYLVRTVVPIAYTIPMKAPLIVEFEEQPPGKVPNGETMDTSYCVVRYDLVLERGMAKAA